MGLFSRSSFMLKRVKSTRSIKWLKVPIAEIPASGKALKTHHTFVYIRILFLYLSYRRRITSHGKRTKRENSVRLSHENCGVSRVSRAFVDTQMHYSVWGTLFPLRSIYRMSSKLWRLRRRYFSSIGDLWKSTLRALCPSPRKLVPDHSKCH